MKVKIKDIDVDLKVVGDFHYIKEADAFKIQNSIKGRRILKMENICFVSERCWINGTLYHPLKMKIDTRQRLTNCSSILSMVKVAKPKSKNLKKIHGK